LENNLNIEKSAGVYFYIDKIIVETRNKRDEYTWYSTANVTLLPMDVSDEKLGLTVLEHLKQSEVKDITLEDIKNLREEFKKKDEIKIRKGDYGRG